VWATDRVNGAAYLARGAVVIAAAQFDKGSSISQVNVAQSIAMLRPTMVPIVNVMNEFDTRSSDTSQSKAAKTIECGILESLDLELERCVNLAVKNILQDYDVWKATSSRETFVIGTFSRSSTLKSILERVLESRKYDEIQVICSQSTPGNEGELMARDISNSIWLPDTEFQRCVSEGKVNLVIVGADCILSNDMGIVNKIGTHDLAKTCKISATPIKCFADRWKLWDDIYPPPLESIFEVIPRCLLDDVVVPSSPE
jgi:translation initiation factor 2B subunit (eIF-2B alpha/beta/delta family)